MPNRTWPLGRHVPEGLAQLKPGNQATLKPKNGWNWVRIRFVGASRETLGYVGLMLAQGGRPRAPRELIPSRIWPLGGCFWPPGLSDWANVCLGSAWERGHLEAEKSRNQVGSRFLELSRDIMDYVGLLLASVGLLTPPGS